MKKPLLLVAAALVVAALLPSAVMAGGFQVTPTLAQIPEGARVATFELHNRGTEAVTVQVDAYAWSQDTGGDHTAPAQDVVIAPRIATLAPGKSQLVRLSPRGAGAPAHAYRVVFREVPPPPPPGFMGVRTLVEHNVPLFFKVAGEPQMAWRARVGAQGELLVSAANGGTRYYRATSLKLTDAGGNVLVADKGPRYALPQSVARWSVRTRAKVAAGDRVNLQIGQETGTQDVALTVE